jgi:hypothetical protein
MGTRLHRRSTCFRTYVWTPLHAFQGCNVYHYRCSALDPGQVANKLMDSFMAVDRRFHVTCPAKRRSPCIGQGSTGLHVSHHYALYSSQRCSWTRSQSVWYN